jgi:hypothetical protein
MDSGRRSQIVTENEALKEAQRRFGPAAAVYCFHDVFFEVGVRTKNLYVIAYGLGDCWESAFEDAEGRYERPLE